MRPRKALRVLLVEDSEDDALLIVRELRRGGYEPDWERVETPEAMQEALAGSDWDVIVSDHRMPRFGALEPLALYRQSGSEATFVVVSGAIVEGLAIEATKAGADDYVMKDNLARLCVAVERGLRQNAQRRRAERELEHRDAILEAVRFAAERLLGEAGGWEESIRAVLGRLGEATGVSRVYVFENYVREDGELRATYRYEWLAAGVSAQIDNPAQKDFPYRASGYGRWIETLGRGEPVYGNTRDFPAGEQPELRAQDILSIVVVPIFVEGNWWGVIGFDEREREREWSAAEVGVLGAAAGTLGAAIRRKRVDDELRASEAELRAVFGAMDDVILVLDGEGRYLKIAPTNPSLLYRPPGELVGKTLHDTFPRAQADAFLGSVRRALNTRQRVEIEYSLPIGDRELWFSTTISPMLENSVVAVARDVTERARMLALLEERQRVARELHDSVSKALYGIALGANTAREEFEDNPAEVPELLDYILSLSEAGMAEMRALIFELRPESLENEGVVAALMKQAAALEARHAIEVETDLCEEPDASLETKEAVYRIAQETLHNTAKHARASNVRITMRCAGEQMTLEISDDGVGFDPGGDFPGHLGLRSMRERAERVGGTLEVRSAPGTGTRIYTRIPL